MINTQTWRCVLAGLLVGAVLVGPASGQWVQDPGTGWVQFDLAHHNTETRFNENAQTESLFNQDARSITTTATVAGALGLFRGVDLWAEVPFHHLQFNDVVRERTSMGPGDPKVFLRTGPALVGIDELPVALALRSGVKIPVGKFDVDAEVIPLSEGQRDWEVLLEAGTSLHPRPLYVMGWVGYRWRETNRTTGFKPGDERFFHLAMGGDVAPLTWKLALDGFFGRPPQSFGLPLEQNRRELVQVLPKLGWELGPGALEAGLRVPVHGRNFPAGPTVTLGYFLTWDTSLWD